MTAIETDKRRIQRSPQATVWIADALREADFVEVPYLWLDKLRITCGPEVDQAHFTYIYGDMIRDVAFPETPSSSSPSSSSSSSRATTMQYYPPIDLAGKFVKVWIPDTVYEDFHSGDTEELEEEAEDGAPESVTNCEIYWYGRIEHDERDTHGTLIGSPNHMRGEQSVTAFGLLRLLEQEVIDTSYVEIGDPEASSSSASSSGSLPADVYKVQTGLDFNIDPGGQYALRGNRCQYKHYGSYLFSWNPRGQFVWSARDAVEYLLMRQVPLDGSATGAFANYWRLDCSDPNYLDWYDIDMKTNGRTVKEVIDRLIPRQRGVGYFVDFDKSNDQIVLHIFTFSSSSVTLPNGDVLAANPNTRTLNFESALDIVSAVISDTVVTKYHRVVARGEQRTTTFTTQIQSTATTSAALIKAWDTGDEADYKNAASSDADYGSLTLAQQQQRNAIYRASPSLDEVYRRFKLNDTLGTFAWNCQIKDPLGVNTTAYDLRGAQFVIPFSAVNSTEPAGYVGNDYVPALRVMRATPFYEGVDYSSTNLSSFDYKTIVTGLRQPSFIPPMVFAQTSTLSSSSSSSSSSAGANRYELMDRLSRSWEAAGDRTWACRVGILDTEPGIEITANPPHLLSGNSDSGFAAMSPAESPANRKGIAYTNMFVTLTVELTEHAQQEWTMYEPPVHAPEQVLIINVPNARFDYVLPWTVVDVKDGKAIQTTSGGFTRNDTNRLLTIALTAAEWYSQERQTLNLEFQQIRGIFQRGWLITDIGADYELSSSSSSASSSSGISTTRINTPVTAITYTLARGDRPGSTAIETSYSELDFSSDLQP